MKLLSVILFFIPIVLLGACSGSGGLSDGAPEIVIEDAWTRSAGMEGGHNGGEMGSNGAAYMVIRNIGSSPDKLLKADSEVSEVVEIHLSEMKDGVMSMHPVDYIEIPARGATELKPGGFHIMLINLKQALNEGEKVTLTLEFEQSGVIAVDAEVRAP